jgi:UDP-N-acetylglucosamine 1-carboxyvinyltransferase
MDTFVIQGGRRLSGKVRVNGSKNAALPMISAALLTDQPVVLRDVPPLADIGNMVKLMAQLGVHRLDDADPTTIKLQSVDESLCHAKYEIVKTMRASICTLGPMLARRGFAQVSMPGGCAIGDRPVDLHLRGLAALGAQITVRGGDIIAKQPVGGLQGTTVFLGGPFGSTVLGTANVLCAATLAKGRTTIECAACEPEIVDLANLLITMGAKIQGAGSPRIIIDGVKELGGADVTVIPDRIEAGTFMMAAAITNGDLTIENCPLDALLAATHVLEHAGIHIESATPGSDSMHQTVRVVSDRILKPVEVSTQPHPGFPTDLQAQLVALLTLADGNSVLTERIFPDRFLHVAELLRMGAKIVRQGPTVVITGVRKLIGAPVMASDLRASAGLVLAGMAAEGTTVISRVYHLDRGYDRLEDRLRSLGAAIERIDDRDLAERGLEALAG